MHPRLGTVEAVAGVVVLILVRDFIVVNYDHYHITRKLLEVLLISCLATSTMQTIIGGI